MGLYAFFFCLAITRAELSGFSHTTVAIRLMVHDNTSKPDKHARIYQPHRHAPAYNLTGASNILRRQTAVIKNVTCTSIIEDDTSAKYAHVKATSHRHDHLIQLHHIINKNIIL